MKRNYRKLPMQWAPRGIYDLFGAYLLCFLRNMLFAQLCECLKINYERSASMDTKFLSLDRRGFLKGVAVGVGGCALGASLIHPLEVMGQTAEGSLDKIPIETRWKIASGLNVYNMVTIWKLRYDTEGPEKYNEGSKKRSLGAGAWVKGRAKDLGLTGNDAKSIVIQWSTLVPIWAGPDQKYEVVQATAEKARMIVTNCAYWNTMQQLKIKDDICSSGSQYDFYGFVKATNPKMTSTLVKARPRGDSVCEWEVKLEV